MQIVPSRQATDVRSGTGLGPICGGRRLGLAERAPRGLEVVLQQAFLEAWQESGWEMPQSCEMLRMFKGLMPSFLAASWPPISPGFEL